MPNVFVWPIMFFECIDISAHTTHIRSTYIFVHGVWPVYVGHRFVFIITRPRACYDNEHTQDPIWKKLLSFSIPRLFQPFYSIFIIFRHTVWKVMKKVETATCWRNIKFLRLLASYCWESLTWAFIFTDTMNHVCKMRFVNVFKEN